MHCCNCSTVQDSAHIREMKGGPDLLFETGERILAWFFSVKYEWISNSIPICSHKCCMFLSYSTSVQDTIIQDITRNQTTRSQSSLVLLNILSNVISYIKKITMTSPNPKCLALSAKSNQSLFQRDVYLRKISVFLSALTESFHTEHINEQLSFYI